MAKKKKNSDGYDDNEGQLNMDDMLFNADQRHYRDTEQYVSMAEKLYNQAINRLTELATQVGNIPQSESFSFSHNKAVSKKVMQTISDLAAGIEAVVDSGCRHEWDAACIKGDKYIEQIKKTADLAEEKIKTYQDRNLEALAAFQERKVEGLNLSERVWKMVSPVKEEVELVVDTTAKYYDHGVGINTKDAISKIQHGIGSGTSAAELSREVRECLREPNKLFRRVRDKYGNLTLSKAAELYHPGQGVYRSSYKNAMRMCRTEINMAYRQSDSMRWQQLDFVVGMKINLSNNHTTKDPKSKGVIKLVDICDKLKGDYPKDFKFVGWHPQCRCFSTPILKTLDEIAAEGRNIDADGNIIPQQSQNAVTDVPDNYKKYMQDNAERIAGWSSTPYYIKDNPQYFDKAIHPERYKGPGLVLNEDQTKLMSELQAYGNNHQGSKKFAAAFESAQKAQLAGDIESFNKALKEMVDISKSKTFNFDSTKFETISFDDIEEIEKKRIITQQEINELLYDKNKAHYFRSSHAETINDNLQSQAIGKDIPKDFMDEKSRNLIELLDSVIDKNKTDRDLRVVRYVHERWLDEKVNRLNVGDTFIEHRYTSSSAVESANMFATRRVKVIIDIPKGEKSLFVNEFFESEVVLPRNTKFQILSRSIDEDGKTTLRLGVVPQKISEQKNKVQSSPKEIRHQYDSRIEAIKKKADLYGLDYDKVMQAYTSLDIKRLESVINEQEAIIDKFRNDDYQSLSTIVTELTPTKKQRLRQVQKLMQTFADEQPHNFVRDFKTIKYSDEGSQFYMSTDCKGTISVNFARDEHGFDAGTCIVSAFKKISHGIELLPHEEYAVEVLWHEVMHNRTAKLVILPPTTAKDVGFQTSVMETINQLCARHSYPDFLYAIGGKAKYQQWVLDNGYGYGAYVSNFRKLLSAAKINEKEFVKKAESILLNDYTDIDRKIANLLEQMYKGNGDIRNCFNYLETKDMFQDKLLTL